MLSRSLCLRPPHHTHRVQRPVDAVNVDSDVFDVADVVDSDVLDTADTADMADVLDRPDAVKRGLGTWE